jgi:hypothetical protein
MALLGLAACSGSGNGGSASHPIGDAAIKTVAVVARAAAFQRPVDAAPSPDGSVVYYLSVGDRGPAVLSVRSGGGAASSVASGTPFSDPTGVAVATDGSAVFVADGQAGGSGAILTAPTTGTATTVTMVGGTQGRTPKGLDVVKQSGADVIYFTGTDPANNAVGLFKVPAAGGTVTTVAEGAPFVAPDSVVVAANGDAFVSDQGRDVGEGVVFRVNNGNLKPVLTQLRLGAPAGVTLTNGDATVLVSSIDAATLSDQVLFLDLATGKTTTTTKVVGANKNSSGGLHRASNAAVLAWADVSRSGRVYRIEPA